MEAGEAQKKPAVAATPGKTKHFQTLRVPDVPSLLLCDCPGLVFPTVAGSKAQMLCDGILPADQMRDCMPPIRRLYALLGPPAFFPADGGRLRTDAAREDDADAPATPRAATTAISQHRTSDFPLDSYCFQNVISDSKIEV